MAKPNEDEQDDNLVGFGNLMMMVECRNPLTGKTHALGLTADDVLNEVSKLARYNQIAGEFTITVLVRPNQDKMEVSATMKAKLPIGKAGAASFYSDKEGNLVQDDPRQDPLPGLEVVRNIKGEAV